MRTPDEIRAMAERLDEDIHAHGWDASVDAAMRALEWALGADWPNLAAYMERPDADRRREWIARGGNPEHWPQEPRRAEDRP